MSAQGGPPKLLIVNILKNVNLMLIFSSLTKVDFDILNVLHQTDNIFKGGKILYILLILQLF